MAAPQNLIAGYLHRLLNTAESHPSLTKETTFASNKELDEAASALQSLQQYPERRVADEHLTRLEAIILPLYRPVFNIVNDTYTDPPAPWNGLAGKQTREYIHTAIKAVGRVDLNGYPGRKFGGTAFIVGNRLLLTNRHVAELFASGIGDEAKSLTFVAGRKAALDLKQEVVPTTPVPLAVVRVVLVHPYWDAALLEVDGLPHAHPQLLLDSIEPKDLDGTDVVVIGYPALDPSGNVDVQIKVFGGRFDKKRLQPGKTMGYRTTDSYGRQVQAIAHDCSTLGGNSGSVVLNLSTGNVLGLHFAGEYLKANYAVPAWQLALDDRVQKTGVTPSPKLSGKEPAPQWLSAWDNPNQTAVARSISAEQPSLPHDWFERTSPSELTRAYFADRDVVMDTLSGTLGASGARDLAAILDSMQLDFDPARPEIVWIHGAMGAHLASPDLLRERRWLDAATLANGQLAKSLAFATDADRSLETDGPIRALYLPAHLAWRRAGFLVHDFVYDWRRSLTWVSDCLHRFLSMRRCQFPHARFALVAHSTGGLVCAIYATRHPQWSDLVQRAIFIGTPLAGTFAPAAALTGALPLFAKLSFVSPANNLDALARMVATFPGWLNALPDPRVFPDSATLYTANAWPGEIAPQQSCLDQSLFLKPLIRRSPLLDRVTVLASARHPTVGCVTISENGIACGPATMPGDGATPLNSAALDGLPAFALSAYHWELPREREAVQAVTDLLTSGVCALPRISSGDLRPLPPRDCATSFTEGASTNMLHRLRNGQVRSIDLDWLLRPIFDNLPD